MRTLYPSLLGIACCAFVLSCSGQAVSQSAADVNAASQTVSSPIAADPSALQPGSQHNALPDSPGATLAAQEVSPQNSGSQSSGQTPDNAPPAPGQAAPQKPQRPVGTAAAEAPKVSGITAAQPAGVAIAPAKQHRVRKIVLRVGAIVGAGAAVGTVIALTAATSSKPPGAH